MNYRPEIDGLRALAVLPVVLFHAKFPLFSGGFAGVDVFFVISGYLITAIILESLERGRFSLKSFYDRRIRRIMPALFTVLIVSVFFAVLLLPPANLTEFGRSLIATVTFSANFLFWSQAGYFDTQSDLKPLLHTWSLAVEEQFYVLFPLLVVLLFKIKFNARMAVLILITISSFLLALIAVYHRPSAAFFLLPTRGWELLCGALLAVLLRQGASLFFISPRLKEYAAALGFIMLIFSFIVFDESTKFPGAAATIPVAGTCLLICFASQQNLTGRVLSHPWLVSIGLISYSLYLWHNPILVFIRFWTLGSITIEVSVLAIMLAMLLSYLTWRFIEKPCRDVQKVSSTQVFTGVLVSGIILIGVGYYLVQKNGLPERLGDNQALLATALPSPLRQRCHNSETHKVDVQSGCEYFGEDVKVATFGDSHVVEISYALAEQLKPYNIGLKQFSYTACEPSFGSNGTKDACKVWTEQAVDYILKSNVSTVVVSYRIHGALFGYHEKYYPNFPDLYSDIYRAEVWSAYLNLLKAFLNAGKKVVLVLQAPELKANISQLVFAHGQKGTDVVSMSRAWVDHREFYVRQRLDQIPRDVVVVDPIVQFCDQSNCYASKNGKAIYFDEDHLSVYGAGLLVEQFMPVFALTDQHKVK